MTNKLILAYLSLPFPKCVYLCVLVCPKYVYVVAVLGGTDLDHSNAIEVAFILQQDSLASRFYSNVTKVLVGVRCCLVLDPNTPLRKGHSRPQHCRRPNDACLKSLPKTSL